MACITSQELRTAAVQSIVRCRCCRRSDHWSVLSDHWSVCPHEVELEEEATAASCRWLMVDGRNSLRYDLPYTLYVSAVNFIPPPHAASH